MTASYTWADKTCEKVDAQIWVFFTTPSVTNLHKDPTHAPIESSVLAQSGKNKHDGGAGPANQNQAFKNRVFFLPEQK